MNHSDDNKILESLTDLETEKCIENWLSPFRDHPDPDEDDEDTPYWMPYDEPISRFSFRASWMEAIDKLTFEEGNDLIHAIMEYAFEGAYSPVCPKVDILMQQIMYEIMQQKNRFQAARQNGELGGRPLKNAELRAICLNEPNLTAKDIAARSGVSLRTVQRCLQQIADDYAFIKQSYLPGHRPPEFSQLEKALKDNLAFKHYRKHD